MPCFSRLRQDELLFLFSQLQALEQRRRERLGGQWRPVFIGPVYGRLLGFLELAGVVPPVRKAVIGLLGTMGPWVTRELGGEE